MKFVERLISQRVWTTIGILYFGFTKIPMLFFARPSIVEMSIHRVVVKIPLRRRTKNHLGSMYFGALAVGADCAAGLLAMHLIRKRPEHISLIFKDLKADFLKRAEGDVHFTCVQGREIASLVTLASESDERVELPVNLIATVPSQSSEPVATFTLTLSLKKQI